MARPSCSLALQAKIDHCFAMSKRRLSGEDRRASILEAAQTIFARDGFDRAKTQQIAKLARISEALVFRHFPTKSALYRAVLRKLITDQDESIAAYGSFDESGAGLIQMMERTFRHVLKGRQASSAEGTRILFGSFVGESDYARLTYRRALRLVMPRMLRAIDAARAAGEFHGPTIDPVNFSAFIEHISSMMMMMRLPEKPIVTYAGDDDQLVRDAVWFCARGLGLREEVMAAHFQEPIKQADEPASIAPARPATRQRAPARSKTKAA